MLLTPPRLDPTPAASRNAAGSGAMAAGAAAAGHLGHSPQAGDTVDAGDVSALCRSVMRQPDLHGGLAVLRRWLVQQGFTQVHVAWFDPAGIRMATECEAGTPNTALWHAAMEEALDQGQALTWPQAHGAPQEWVTLAQRQLAAHGNAAEGMSEGPGGAMTVILPGVSAPLGAMAMTWPEGVRDVATWQALAVEVAPILAWQRHAGRPWHWHAWQALRRAWLKGRHGMQASPKRAWGIGLTVAASMAAVPLPENACGMARIEGAQQRVLVAASDGFIKQVHAQPGDRVKAGQVLADLAEQDLKLEREKWASQAAQQDNAYAAAMTRADRAEAAQALARLEEAQAQLALVDEQLQRAQLKAPFDGLVIQGDLTQSIGAPVKQGDTLMTVASTRRWRVIAEIDETDVARVRIGQIGEIALSALPWDTLPLRVRRITPLAQAKEGRNLFEVEAEFTAPVPSDVRPGLTGQAKIKVDSRPMLWTWLRPLVDRARLGLWSWWG